MSVHSVLSLKKTTGSPGQTSQMAQGKAFMQSSPHRARPPPGAQEDPGCMMALLPTGASMSAHFSAFLDFSLEALVVQQPMTSALGHLTTRDTTQHLLPWWLWVVQHHLSSSGNSLLLSALCRTPALLLLIWAAVFPPAASAADTTLAPLSPGTTWLQCLHRLAVLLFGAFPPAWQVRPDGHWWCADLWVVSCCP